MVQPPSDPLVHLAAAAALRCGTRARTAAAKSRPIATSKPRTIFVAQMSGAKTPNSHTAAHREVELACLRLCEENKLLMDTIQVLEAALPNPMPDGLDRRVSPNLFAFMGCARIARAEGELVKASSQAHVTFDQGDWKSSPHPIQRDNPM